MPQPINKNHVEPPQAADSESPSGIFICRYRSLIYSAMILAVAASLVTHGWAWGGKPHSYIIDAALTAIPPEDQLAFRLGSEARHLHNTVQMGDWVDSLVVVNENWHVTTEDFTLDNSEYFGNDYLIFPSATHAFHHDIPEVKETYRPFFLRSLQALRSEDTMNAVRWMGALLHFVTDSGSPPHAISLHGDNHGKMENWLDAAKIDLSGYQPRLLGRTDEEAVNGLEVRMNQLIARNAVIAKRMVPFAEANDRVHVEPLAIDCATETAKVAADVMHTLLVLSAPETKIDSASMIGNVSAPALVEHPLLPAKLVLLGTSISTLSATAFSSATEYSGSFSLAHLAPGTYVAAIERPGADTLFTSEFNLKKGEQALFSWALTGTDNLVQNSDFRLRWVMANVPDHWHLDPATKCWLSDNIPVIAGHRYQASTTAQTKRPPRVRLQWMAQHWKMTDDPMTDASGKAVDVVAPPTAVYVRFCIEGEEPPSNNFLHVRFSRVE